MKHRYKEYKDRKQAKHHKYENYENEVGEPEKGNHKTPKKMPVFQYVKGHSDLSGVKLHNTKRENDERYKQGLEALSDLL